MCTSYIWGAHDSLVVSMLDCQQRGWWFKSPPGKKFVSRFLLNLRNSAVMTEDTDVTLFVGKWDGEGEDFPPSSYSEPKNRRTVVLLLHSQQKYH